MLEHQNKTDMNPEPIDLDQIEAYLNNKLSATEKAAFEEAIQNDLELAVEVKEVSQMIQGIKYTAYKRRQLTNYFESLRDQIETDSPISPPVAKKQTVVRPIFSSPWAISGIAASFALLFAVAVFWNQQASPEQLLAEYHKGPYPVLDANSMISRGQTSEAKTKREEAFIAYASGEYEEAIQLFITILREEQDIEVQFYLANAYFETEKTKEAIVHFQELVVNENRYKTRSMWYLILCHLKQQDMDEAKKIATQLSKEQDSYSLKAKDLLKKLGNWNTFSSN